MPPDPPVKRTVVFVDGQNLFHAAREAFGYTYPNYDIRALAERMCAGRGWQLTQARFYTGIPDPQDDPRWHHFWSAKLAVMGRQDVHVYSRSLRYRNRTVHLPDGTTHTFLAGEEKGIDVRVALDIIRMAHRGAYDVGLVLSQDQDLSEVADEIREIAREQSPVDQDRLRVSFQPNQPEPPRHRQDRLDQDRPCDLRRVPRPAGLPERRAGGRSERWVKPFVCRVSG